MTGLPNCLDCTHYYITYDPARPYGCRGLGFKSRTSPARVVYEASGIHCQLFTAKKQRNDGSSRSSRLE